MNTISLFLVMSQVFNIRYFLTLLCMQFVTNWFKIVLGERESEGVDFWWLDWGQGRGVCRITFNVRVRFSFWLYCDIAGEDWIKIPLVNPTFWLNYIFFTNPYHWNTTVRLLKCDDFGFIFRLNFYPWLRLVPWSSTAGEVSATTGTKQGSQETLCQ